MKNYRAASLALLLILSSAGAAAQTVYKCEIEGQPTKYQNVPCAQEERGTITARYEPSNTATGAVFCELETPPPAGTADRCLDAYRSSLLDASGAYVVSAKMAVRANHYRVIIEGRTKNKFGGPVELHISCSVDEAGHVQTAETAELIKTWSAFQDLKLYDMQTTIATKSACH